MDITSLRNISSGAVKSAADTYLTELRNGQDIQEDEAFGSLFDKAVQNLNTTNAYLSDAENEKIKWAQFIGGQLAQILRVINGI